ncbi:bile acid-transporting ATPase YBT1 [Sugiyamaella lignohabitans]|uniref:Bile acid-transporting ATPase YBT1 n=1 Tax=Sugiyamaella lignohabitans TaxID=796027 RepID=A0A167FTX5_9ASCO|nr:bile acid-transporting ATPase YBT1 [Sugiyamaella lignohabitans]ANB15699.1 bile acid-transporting ATPase YBT1 [Sugiyamaella lignohabitans]
MIWKGYWTPLEMSDVWELREDDHAYHVLKKFRKIKRTTNFALKLVIHFKRELLVAGFWAVLYSFTTFGPSLILKKILEYVENPNSIPTNVAWLYVFGIFAFGVIDNVGTGQALFIGRRICIRMRAIIIGEVYAKALRRKAVAGGDSNLGKKSNSDGEDSNKEKDENEDSQANMGAIINLMAVDAFKVSEICGYLHYFVSASITILVAIWFLYFILSWSAFVGAAAMLVIMPLNYWFSEKFAQYQDELMSVTDQRVQKTNELLTSIRIIKYFAWEDKFAQGVSDIREKELAILKKRYLLWAFGAFIWYFTPLLITVSSFASFTLLQGRELTAPIAFTALSLFNILKFPLDQLAEMLSNVIQSKVSVDRIEQFLNEDETHKYEQLNNDLPRGPNSPYIGFEKANFSWVSSVNSNDSSNIDSSEVMPKRNDFKLRDIDIKFAVGELNVIIGPTGSGKTSLLMALLGEMDLDSGRVYLPSAHSREEVRPDSQTGLTETVAYCSQQAWLLNDTLKNNIIFASEFNEERYKAVIKACALTRDLEILEAGDETEIGEKGINLSGGQKQRISLARAIYSSSRHLILDDCLSAVDSHTALWIYENCLTGPIVQNRTVILVSHNVALTIAQASHVVIMDNGRIKAQGTPAYLASSGALGKDELIMQSASQSASQIATRSASQADLTQLKDKSKPLGGKELADRLKKAKIKANTTDAPSSVSSDDETLEERSQKKKGTLIEDETRSTGTVNKEVYMTYLRSMGNLYWWFVLAFLFCLQPLVGVAQLWWTREWTDSGYSDAAVSMFTSALGLGESNAPGLPVLAPPLKESIEIGINTIRAPEHSTGYYITVYALIGFLLMIVASIKDLTMFMGGLRASRILFHDFLESVLKAKIRFFDSTPVGRLMNRFSKDMEGIDQDLAPVIGGTARCLIQALATAIVITVVTPQFAIAGVFIFLIYWAIGVFYLATSRELKRHDSVTKSPIYQQFGETLVGVSTIRAYGDERRFIRENMKKIDTNNRPFFYMWVSNRWLSFRVDTAAAFVSFCASAFVILNLNHLDSGLAGLSLSYALSFSENVLWIVRLYAMLEMNMNSVERIQEYMKVDSEAPTVTDIRPPSDWPSRGEIEIENLSLRYAADLPLVIKNVTFKVERFNKIGIVGRTGAGKSTIITALFRFIEAETGFIKIDGLDISTLGLFDLRRALAIIPQDPTLFTGTIRSNLDPFSEYNDQQIFEALRRVHLIPNASNPGEVVEVVEGENVNQFLNLDSQVSEGGGNLSQGQRQLMCLARSLLKAPKVLLLDEATASIDYETDAKIQNTIREEFKDTTILTIAHRLRSIIDYDKILVMDAGQAVEYDTPHSLISNPATIFHNMCSKSGEMEALQKLAHEASKA